MSVLPNFIGIGVPKAGTTSIHFALRGHPEALLVPSKEAHFFDHGYSTGLSAYSAIFEQHWKGQKIVGDITPEYSVHKRAIERIARDLPDAKIVVSFRHPLARSYSHYLHAVRLLQENRPFSDHCGAGIKETYVGPSRYSENFALMQRLFPPENMLVLIFERDIAGGAFPRRGYRRICEFLGIAPQAIGDVKEGGAFIPQIEFVEQPKPVRVDGGVEVNAAVGDVIIRSVFDTGGVRTKVEQVTEERREWLRSFETNITRSVSPDVFAAATKSLFQDEIARMRELTGDTIPEWTNV